MSDQSVGDKARVRQSPRPRSGVAALALVLAIAALSLSAYEFYRSVTGGRGAAALVTSDVLTIEQQRQADELQRIAGVVDGLSQRLGDGTTADQGDAAQGAAPVKSNADAALADRTFKLIEAEYLLQAANDRIKVTGDARDALAMAVAAQMLLERIDDPALASVRSAVAHDVAALRDASSVDVDAINARLQALLHAIPDLPVRGKRYEHSAMPNTGQPPPTGLAAAWHRILSLFEFRRQSGALRPPLGPDEATYLRLNLGLMVQTAQLALLRHDAEVYRQSLESMRGWLDDYLDTGATAVASARADIEELASVPIDRTHPDIGGSLEALRPFVPAVSAPQPVQTDASSSAAPSTTTSGAP